MRPKVAFIFTHQIQYFSNLLEALEKRGEVELLSFYANRTETTRDKGFDRVIKWDNQVDLTFRSVVLEGGWLRWAGSFWSTFRLNLFAELERFDPDVVHLNGFANIIQWQAWLWARLRKKRIVARGDGDLLNDNARKQNSVSAFLTKLFCRHVDQILYQGSENLRYWESKGASRDKMTWIPCVPDSRVYRHGGFDSPEERQSFRATLGIQPQDVVFLVSGKLEPRKRPTDALRALSHCGDIRAKLWLVGSGQLSVELDLLKTELCLEDRVKFWGFQNQTQLPKILQAADVCLHLSEHDPWPYSVLECAISGQSLLLSDKTGSHPDLITNEQQGMTFRCGDIVDLAAKIKLLCSDTTLRNAQRANIQGVVACYVEETFCDILEGVVQSPLTPSSH